MGAIDGAVLNGVIASEPQLQRVLHPFLNDFDISWGAKRAAFNATLYQFIAKPSAIFFGTEKNGLSEEVIEQADGFIKIPMVGYTESLNISVSAAIIIQDITTRLRQSNINWQLTEEEVLEKRLDWTRKSIKDIEFIEKKFHEVNSNG